MPRESRTRTCVSLRSAQLDALRGVSRETGAPVAELTRRAVDLFLAGKVAGSIPASQHSAPIPSEVGASSPTTSRS